MTAKGADTGGRVSANTFRLEKRDVADNGDAGTIKLRRTSAKLNKYASMKIYDQSKNRRWPVNGEHRQITTDAA
jgi:hypothetical protein